MYLSSSQIVVLLSRYKYGPLLILAGLEGPFVTLLAGYLASKGILNLSLAFGAVVVGDFIADVGYYLIGRYGRGQAIEKWTTRIGLTPSRKGVLERQFHKRGGWLLIFGKITHGIGGAVLVVAGLACMPFWRFATYNLAATLIKSAILLGIGYRFGRSLDGINSALDITAVVFVTASILGGFYYFSHQEEKKVLAS